MDLLTAIKDLLATRTATAANELGGLMLPKWTYQAATQDRRAWRALKRAKGARQARLQKKAERRAVREEGL